MVHSGVDKCLLEVTAKICVRVITCETWTNSLALENYLISPELYSKEFLVYSLSLIT
jgi:hypothetical protein